MPRSFKLAILRARHDRAFTPVPDSDCRTFLVEAKDRSALLQYWTDATMGHLRFDDLWMFPWVDIAADPSVEAQAKRGPLARAAIAATEALGHDLSSYHGFVVLVPPGTRTVTDPDGTTRVVSPPSLRATMPAWSPDGRHLALVGTEGDPDALDLYVVAVEGGAWARLTDHPAPDWLPHWSPR
ncbi:MAG: PD40 domain-containing protein [Myxococcales bacterium]|nr:PD40 domain-containing protein [Myxococcales bacterium]